MSRHFFVFALLACAVATEPMFAQQDACSFDFNSNQFDSGVSRAGSGDWDGDGDIDLAVFLPGPIEIALLENDGFGQFSVASTFPTGNDDFDAASAILADMDGDNDLDLVVRYFVDQRIGIFLNDGNGVFTDPLNTDVSFFSSGVGVVDLDGDSDLDLIVPQRFEILSGAPGIVEIFLNNGDATFEPGISIASPPNPGGPSFADLNGDDQLDMVMGGSSTLSVYLGNGDGTFGPEMQFSAPTRASIVYLADFDGDGALDVVLSNFSNGIFTLRGDGQGGFDNPTAVVLDDDESGYRIEIGVFDIDGDQDIDLLALDGGGSEVELYLNDGTGNFDLDFEAVLGEFSPNAVPLGDFDGDGTIDAAISFSSGELFQLEADLNRDNEVNLLDIQPFVNALQGGP